MREKEETNENDMDQELLQEGNSYQIRIRRLIVSYYETDSIYLTYNLVFSKQN